MAVTLILLTAMLASSPLLSFSRRTHASKFRLLLQAQEQLQLPTVRVPLLTAVVRILPTKLSHCGLQTLDASQPRG